MSGAISIVGPDSLSSSTLSASPASSSPSVHGSSNGSSTSNINNHSPSLTEQPHTDDDFQPCPMRGIFKRRSSKTVGVSSGSASASRRISHEMESSSSSSTDLLGLFPGGPVGSGSDPTPSLGRRKKASMIQTTSPTELRASAPHSLVSKTHGGATDLDDEYLEEDDGLQGLSSALPTPGSVIALEGGRRHSSQNRKYSVSPSRTASSTLVLASPALSSPSHPHSNHNSAAFHAKPPPRPVHHSTNENPIEEDLAVTDCVDAIPMDHHNHVHRSSSSSRRESQSRLMALQQPCQTVGVQEGRKIRQLLLGALSSLPSPWETEGFHPSPHIWYGLQQQQGGPCGVLAVVQAYMVKFAFHQYKVPSPTKRLRDGKSEGWGDQVTEGAEQKPPEFASLLASALACVIWNAAASSTSKTAFVCLPPGGQPSDVSRSSIDQFRVFSFTDATALLEFIESKIGIFTSYSESTLLLLITSCVLSRGGVDAVRGDMDTPTGCLIVDHGYCSQELVNLCMVGVACTNVFDGVQAVPGSPLGGEQPTSSGAVETDQASAKTGTSAATHIRGVPKQSDVGFLSYYEYLRFLSVGSFCKNPTSAVWILCSESHYSVLFCKHAKIPDLASSPSASSAAFDVFHFDPLSNQTDELRLTVSFAQSSGSGLENGNVVQTAEGEGLSSADRATSKASLVSSNGGDFDAFGNPVNVSAPIEDMIRTRWPGAVVNWNGSERIL